MVLSDWFTGEATTPAAEPWFKTDKGRLYHGNSLSVLGQLPDESVQCVITSPPYWGLRDYETEPQIWGGDPECEHIWDTDSCLGCGAWKGELGQEPTIELYIEHLVWIFREIKRVLKKTGTLFLNMGDSYAGSWGGMNDFSRKGKRYVNKARPATSFPQKGLKLKDLVGMPWRVAFALQADGWWLRSDIAEEQIWLCPCCGKEMVLIRQNCDRDIIWEKPNVQPENVKDRPTRSHEYLFLLSRSKKYYYDAEAIKEPQTGNAHSRGNGLSPKSVSADLKRIRANKSFHQATSKYAILPGGRNKRSIWKIPTVQFRGSHFATFPPKFAETCLLAGSGPGDVIMDPFMGKGTVAVEAEKFGRRWIGIELSLANCRLAKKEVFKNIRQLRVNS